jgi:hypothetical protein
MKCDICGVSIYAMTPYYMEFKNSENTQDDNLYCENCYRKKLSGGGRILMAIPAQCSEEEYLSEEDLEWWKNKWRIEILKSIGSLLIDIADVFEIEETKLIIAYSANECNCNNRSFPIDIMNKNNKPGFVNIPSLFCFIEEINNMEFINNERAYEIVEEIRGMLNLFLSEQKR